MTLNRKHITERRVIRWLLVLFAGFAMLTGCSDDTTAVSEDSPRNLFGGVADGKDFKTTGILAVKDSSDIFVMVGRMLSNQTVLAAFNGKDEREYTITDEGPLARLTEYLSELAADSMMIDSTVLQEIFADSAQLLPYGSSYLIYGIGLDQYFSTRGNITLSIFDGTINRIYGTLEAECVNLLEGVKYINAYFEDVFYLDCPTLDNCSP